MKINLLTCTIFLFFTGFVYAQDFNGQWKGSFQDKSSSFSGWGGDKCDYVLELDISAKKVTGYSYTYFTDGGKKYLNISVKFVFI